MTTPGPSTDDKRHLMIAATGHVGPKIAGRFGGKGLDVTALVRWPGMTIEEPCNGAIDHVGDYLPDKAAIRAALVGIDVLVSTVNGVVSQKKGDDVRSVDGARSVPCASAKKPGWGSAEAVRRFGLTKQLMLSGHLDANTIRNR